MYFILTVLVNDPNRRYPDVSKAKAILGRELLVYIRANLAEMVAWFKNNQIKA